MEKKLKAVMVQNEIYRDAEEEEEAESNSSCSSRRWHGKYQFPVKGKAEVSNVEDTCEVHCNPGRCSLNMVINHSTSLLTEARTLMRLTSTLLGRKR